MAIFKSGTMTSASGSVGGTTYSHNRSGMYMRARRVPVNPNTGPQQEARNAFAAASANWRALSEADRVGWAAYGDATPVRNALGDTVKLTGLQSYVAAAALGAQLGQLLSTYATPPVSPGRIALGSLSVVIDDSANTIVVSGIATNEVTVGVFCGAAVSAGVTFFKGPYQLRGYEAPSAGVVTIAAATGRNGAAFVAGQVIPVRVAGIGDDNRLTTVYEALVTVVA